MRGEQNRGRNALPFSKRIKHYERRALRVGKKISKSTEDYLEAILMIRQKTGQCRSIDVAYHLNVSKPSVSVAMANLEKAGFITREQNHDLKLTRAGLWRARRVLERHHFLTELLVHLGVPRDKAEEDACVMEHDVSQSTYDHMRAWYDERMAQNPRSEA
ncbi:MAG: metal-dependent transcriptional regulator [Clostridia bacterium]|nr:metal-dependent transcriptional regulator [Clostridia bacterium]